MSRLGDNAVGTYAKRLVYTRAESRLCLHFYYFVLVSFNVAESEKKPKTISVRPELVLEIQTSTVNQALAPKFMNDKMNMKHLLICLLIKIMHPIKISFGLFVCLFGMMTVNDAVM